MSNPCQLYRDAEHGLHHFKIMNIREFPLHEEEHHELITCPARVIIQELLESSEYPGVVLTVEYRRGPGVKAYELQQYFPNKPQVGEVYEATMTRPFIDQEREDGEENRSRHCHIEYKKVGQFKKDAKGTWQLENV